MMDGCLNSRWLAGSATALEQLIAYDKTTAQAASLREQQGHIETLIERTSDTSSGVAEAVGSRRPRYTDSALTP
jgi:hypothetical protein